MRRTHTCGELTKKDEGKKVVLQGWVDAIREHGNVMFVNLRDRYGVTQVVLDSKEKLRKEYVVSVSGVVTVRPDPNKKLVTGDIEVKADSFSVISECPELPIDLSGTVESTEETRLKYRYLDLRRPEMQRNIILRHKAVKSVRDYFDALGFLEIETPMLGKSTPEGARDYLVPSRVNKGGFYALPQSPQLFKQLLMVSGFDRYFQIVKCFRDEDLRSDRQPEFTQIDVEMSFIDEEDVFSMVEGLIAQVWKDSIGVKVNVPFSRLTWNEAMEKYGTDKPDLRFGLELVDVGSALKDSGFEVFEKAISSAGMVKCINVPSGSAWSRKEIDKLTEFVKIYGAKGLAWLKYDGEKFDGPILKFLSESVVKKLKAKVGVKKDDLLLFVADHKHFVVNDALGNLRNHLARKLDLVDNSVFKFVWVVDFPLVEFDEDAKRHVAVHHPFTAPKDGDVKLLSTQPGKVRSKGYDLTVNGMEIGGGSIRIHDPEVQKKVFSMLGISESEAKDKFGFLLNALQYGAPPHGGIAFGLDRVIAILTGNESIREVIAFPKNKDAEDLMVIAPSTVSKVQLDEINVSLKN